MGTPKDVNPVVGVVPNVEVTVLAGAPNVMLLATVDVPNVIPEGCALVVGFCSKFNVVVPVTVFEFDVCVRVGWLLPKAKFKPVVVGFSAQFWPVPNPVVEGVVEPKGTARGVDVVLKNTTKICCS